MFSNRRRLGSVRLDESDSSDSACTVDGARSALTIFNKEIPKLMKANLKVKRRFVSHFFKMKLANTKPLVPQTTPIATPSSVDEAHMANVKKSTDETRDTQSNSFPPVPLPNPSARVRSADIWWIGNGRCAPTKPPKRLYPFVSSVDPIVEFNLPNTCSVPDHLRLIPKPGSSNAWYVHIDKEIVVNQFLINRAVKAGQMKVTSSNRRHPDGKWSAFKQSNTVDGKPYRSIWMSAAAASASLAIRGFMCHVLDSQLRMLPDNTFFYVLAQQILPREVTDVGQVMEAQPLYIRHTFWCAVSRLEAMLCRFDDFDTEDAILIACDVVALTRQAEQTRMQRYIEKDPKSNLPMPYTVGKHHPAEDKQKRDDDRETKPVAATGPRPDKRRSEFAPSESSKRRAMQLYQ